MILGCVQPSYLAWIPFFQRMRMADIFVYLDDVEFSKNSFHNRNRIKSAQGPLLLTVPVLYQGHSKDYICDIPINNQTKWMIKHWRSIQLNYSKAKFFSELAPILYWEIYSRYWEKLGALNIALIELLKDFIGLETKCYRASGLRLEGWGNEKLIRMCKRFGTEKFIVKPGTEAYHPRGVFEREGIEFEYLDPQIIYYDQLYGDFIPNLSILDFAMNCGPDSFSRTDIIKDHSAPWAAKGSPF